MMNEIEQVPAVSGEEVLNGALAFNKRFMALPAPEAYPMVTLWQAHTWAIDALETSPRLLFRSAKRASGKTRSMELTALLCAKPRPVTRITEQTLFQLIDLEHPSLFIDEVDTIFRTNNSQVGMQAVLDNGFERGVPVPRTDGKTAIKDYDIFGPVAMSSLRALPDALASRSIEVLMVPRERTEIFDRRFHTSLAHQYAEALASWATSPEVQVALSTAEVEMPKGVIDRDADQWRPLIALADLAGGQWPVLARQACRYFVFGETASAVLTPGQALLRDMRTVWKGQRYGHAGEAMPTEALINGLLRMEPWHSMWTPGRASRELAGLLREFGIEPKVIRFTGDDDLKRGYDRADLDKAWSQAGIAA